MARVGATRGSIITYLIPVVSTALGIGFLDESVAVISAVGMLLVFAGAWLASRAEVSPTVQGAEHAAEEMRRRTVPNLRRSTVPVRPQRKGHHRRERTAR